RRDQSDPDDRARIEPVAVPALFRAQGQRAHPGPHRLESCDHHRPRQAHGNAEPRHHQHHHRRSGKNVYQGRFHPRRRRQIPAHARAVPRAVPGVDHVRRDPVRRYDFDRRPPHRPRSRQPQRRRALSARDAWPRSLRRRAGGMGVEQPLVAARRDSRDGADDFVRARNGARDRVRHHDLRHFELAGNRARTERRVVRIFAALGNFRAAARLHSPARRRRRRIQAHPLRPARRRIGADPGLFHRILRRQAGRLHAHRFRRAGAPRDADNYVLPRRMAGAVAHARRLSSAGRRISRRARAGRFATRHRRVPGQGRRAVHLSRPRAMDAAALPLRPVDGAGLERTRAARTVQRAGHRIRRGGNRERPLMPPFVYIFLGALAIVSALGVVVQRNPIHSLLSLIGTLLTVALLFIAEDAVVVGFLQIIFYAGAIMVLFLFVIWLLNLQVETGPTGHLALKIFGSLGAALLVTELFFILAPPHLQVKFTHEPSGYGSLASLAGKLFTDYLVAFEVTSVLLLAAVVGAVALARRIPAVEEFREVKEPQKIAS